MPGRSGRCVPGRSGLGRRVDGQAQCVSPEQTAAVGEVRFTPSPEMGNSRSVGGPGARAVSYSLFGPLRHLRKALFLLVGA